MLIFVEILMSPKGTGFNKLSVFEMCSKPYAIINQKRRIFLVALIISVYITITLVALFTFAGPYSPLVGLAIGVPIHILILLTKIYKELNKISKKLYE